MVRWSADEDGDGAGYDISSFNLEGSPRLIEVKTTNGSAPHSVFHFTQRVQHRKGNPHAMEDLPSPFVREWASRLHHCPSAGSAPQALDGDLAGLLLTVEKSKETGGDGGAHGPTDFGEPNETVPKLAPCAGEQMFEGSMYAARTAIVAGGD